MQQARLPRYKRHEATEAQRKAAWSIFMAAFLYALPSLWLLTRAMKPKAHTVSCELGRIDAWCRTKSHRSSSKMKMFVA